MRFLAALAVASVLIGGTSIGLSPALAQVKSSPKIAVVDALGVRFRTKAGKSMNKQLSTYRKALQKEAEAQQNKLRAARNELRLQRSLLSPEAVQARERKYRDDSKAAQRRFQLQKKALEQSIIDAVKIYDKHVTEVLKALSKEQKFDIILLKRPSVIYAAPTVNITKEVVKRMDQRVQNIPVKKPGKK